ncbi:NtaA/DmoA family FMN-dependent monooxygenase [Pseudochelatococcus sp. B33]
MSQRELVLFAHVYLLPGLRSAWKLGTIEANDPFDPDYFARYGRLLEEYRFDAIFAGDSPGLGGAISDLADTPVGRLDPLILQSALSRGTTNIGHIVTASTTYNHPYNLARRLSSLDHVSRGRLLWNVVTTYAAKSSKAFGLDEVPDRASRYARAEEFLQVADALWRAWAPDALVGDKATKLWARPDRVIPINHQGQFFRVEGVLPVPYSPQGRPVIIQAGGSEEGRELAGRWADFVFTAQTDLDEAKAFSRDLKERARKHGRGTDELKIIPGLVSIIGSTDEEANRLADTVFELEGEESLREKLSSFLGADVSGYELDQPLPESVLAGLARSESISVGFQNAVVALARDGRLTLRQLLRAQRIGHNVIIGSPERLADHIEKWFTEGAVDGFNVLPDPYPSSLELFATEVVPLLQKKGIFKREYRPGTLREKLGLRQFH